MKIRKKESLSLLIEDLNDWRLGGKQNRQLISQFRQEAMIKTGYSGSLKLKRETMYIRRMPNISFGIYQKGKYGNMFF